MTHEFRAQDCDWHCCSNLREAEDPGHEGRAAVALGLSEGYPRLVLRGQSVPMSSVRSAESFLTLPTFAETVWALISSAGYGRSDSWAFGTVTSSQRA